MGQPNINTFQDILDALETDAELRQKFYQHLVSTLQTDDQLRQDMRQAILTDELLQLPARFLRLEQAVENLLQDMAEVKQDVAVLKTDMVEVKHDVAVLKTDMVEVKQDVAVLKTDMAEVKQDVAVLKTDMVEVKQDVAVLKTDMAEVKQDVAVLKTDMAEVKEQQTTMSGKLANLAGSDYESKAIEQSRRMIRRHLGMTKATVIHASRWEAQTFEESRLLPAIDDGTITRQQADQLEEADSLIRCEDNAGNVTYIAVEISITVEDDDRRRAAARAEILAQLTGAPAQPFTIGQQAISTATGVPEVAFLEYPG